MKPITASTTLAALATIVGLLPISPAQADAGHAVPIPPAAEHSHGGKAGAFKTTGQAWLAVSKSVEAASSAITAGNLAPIHEATEQLDGALRYLQTAGGIADPDKQMRAEAALKQMLTLSAELHAAADAGSADQSAAALKKLQGAIKLVEIQYPAEALAAPSGDMGEMDHGGHHAASSAEPTLKLAVTSDAPLTVGREANVTVRLTKSDGSPVLLSDLVEAHTEKIHLLINDMSLSDYHHEHPTATATPGEYAFKFTPSKPGPYRVWADLLPVATNAQEYAIADLSAPTKPEPLTNRAPRTVVEMDGLKYTITFETPTLKAGEAALGKLTITKPDGTLFSALEPVMGAYAHIVGFGEDLKSIAHVHPMGAEPTKPADRGAGELAFHLLPAAPGLMRLYAQVRIDGQDRFAPFTLEIQP